MLVLSRRDGETIEIPELGIVIQVTSIKKSRVTIGIEAPRDLAILRGEMANGSSPTKSEIDANLNPDCFTIPAAPIAAVKESESDYCISTASESAFFHVA